MEYGGCILYTYLTSAIDRGFIAGIEVVIAANSYPVPGPQSDLNISANNVA